MLARIVHAMRRAWLWITDPPHMRPVFVAVYLVTISGGINTLLAPPLSVAAPIGPVLTVAWASCFIVGGLIGLATVWTDWWWLERIGLFIAGLGGLGTYAGVVIALHLTSETGSRLMQIHVIVLAAALFLARGIAISTYAYRPRAREEPLDVEEVRHGRP